GLVLFTTVAVALLAHHFMGLPLATGFVLGAIISPPDAIAATAIADRLRVPRRIVTILEGESLVNDATALIAYRFAVLAVVTAGLYLGRRMPEILTFQTRLRGGPVWEMVEFLLTGFVFILIGLQLPEVLRALSGNAISIRQLVWYALVISLAVILIRILWVFPSTYLQRLLFKVIREKDPYPSWRHVTIVAWTGMRGVVSLAAALALPLMIQDGSPFPGRDLILFLTFIVILATLVVHGLSLPPLIRWLGIKVDGAA